MTKQTEEPYVSLEITESERGEVSQTGEQAIEGDHAVVPVPPISGTSAKSKYMAWYEKINRILNNRRRVRRSTASAPPTGPELFVITLPESGTITVSLTMEPSFKSSYKEEVKVVKIA
ncbi:hypothetical protein Hanom_Chr03g00238991 [Helianthus anomalus]